MIFPVLLDRFYSFVNLFYTLNNNINNSLVSSLYSSVSDYILCLITSCGKLFSCWYMLPAVAQRVPRSSDDGGGGGSSAQQALTGNTNAPVAAALSDTTLPQKGTLPPLPKGDEVLYFGSGIVIPTEQQVDLMGELHTTQIGASKMEESLFPRFTDSNSHLQKGKRSLGVT